MILKPLKAKLTKSLTQNLNIHRNAHNLRSELFLVTNQTENELSKKANAKTENKSVSSQIMENNGFVQDNGSGLVINLPLGKRVLNKLTEVVREEMNKVKGQEIEMSSLADMKLWKSTGRDVIMGSELFKLSDRQGRELCLCPTHEEIVTSLVSKMSKSIATSCLGNDNSLRLYQITRKYRDESRPKHTLLRAREFLMKDMYSFHLSKECAENTYQEICKAYESLFNRLDLQFIKAEASVGSMGGQKSHEYLIESVVGEDKIYECQRCKKAVSSDLLENCENITQKDLCSKLSCSEANSSGDGNALEPKRCIEIGHTFLLGDRYTKHFPISFGKNKTPTSVLMGCYGVGVSRIMQASVELRHVNKTYPDWPLEIAPYQVAIIPAKKGSELQNKSDSMVPYLYDMFEKNPLFKNDVLIDDRTSLTIGRRVIEAKMIGIPFLVVLGKCIEDEQVEIVINSPSMEKDLEKATVYCHSRETAHVLKQLRNDYFYKLKMKKLGHLIN